LETTTTLFATTTTVPAMLSAIDERAAGAGMCEAPR
jgi:hypothetical protein